MSIICVPFEYDYRNPLKKIYNQEFYRGEIVKIIYHANKPKNDKSPSFICHNKNYYEQFYTFVDMKSMFNMYENSTL